MDMFPDSYVHYGDQILSDHAQLTVFTEDTVAGGPKPFRFYNMWAQHNSFPSIVHQAWSSHFLGTPIFVLCKKLRAVKMALKVWNRDEFGPIQQKVSYASELLHQAQLELAKLKQKKVWRKKKADAIASHSSQAADGDGSESLEVGATFCPPRHDSLRGVDSVKSTPLCLDSVRGADSVNAPPLGTPSAKGSLTLVNRYAILEESLEDGAARKDDISLHGNEIVKKSSFPAIPQSDHTIERRNSSKECEDNCMQGMQRKEGKEIRQISTIPSNDSPPDILDPEDGFCPFGSNEASKLHAFPGGTRQPAAIPDSSFHYKHGELKEATDSIPTFDGRGDKGFMRIHAQGKDMEAYTHSNNGKKIVANIQPTEGRKSYGIAGDTIRSHSHAASGTSGMDNTMDKLQARIRSLSHGDRIRHHLGIPCNITCATFIQNGQWHLPPPTAIEMFDIWPIIMRTPLTQADAITWKHGMFSTKEVWSRLRYQHQKVGWADWVWKAPTVQRFSLTCWQAVMHKLPTHNNLRKRGMIIPSRCILCCNAEECEDHIFFQCSYSIEIWEKILHRLNIRRRPRQNILEEMSSLRASFKKDGPGTSLARILFRAAIWWIWKERCRRTFEDSRLSPIQGTLAIIEDARSCIEANPSPRVPSGRSKAIFKRFNIRLRSS
ncbi:hypothetical protein Taro_055185 [Colocasia esculenta]|uniref:Reverse transcriptase zinc-binding domain-containing protein n=1 Tax=Colocasia esculenta TaxID=4460 RepID=A0A843XTH7_COLES|nr:hypothetical protein [Colocasia esculenta]